VGVAERRVLERKQRERLIIESALRVFARRGIKEATIDEIAEEAELGKGTIYYYFPSKEAILEGAIEATVDAHFDGLIERLKALKAPTPFEIAEVILTSCAQNFKREAESFKVFYMVLSEPTGRLSRALSKFVRRHLEWLDQFEKLAHPVLKEHGLDPQAFVHFIGTHVHGVTMLASSGRSIDLLLSDSLTALKQLLGGIRK